MIIPLPSSLGVLHSAEPFQLLINTTLPGSAADTFILPLNTLQTYNCLVDWGDGNKETVTNAHASFPNIPHVYALAGVKIVSVYPLTKTGFSAIRFNNGGDRRKVTQLLNWGQGTWLRMQGAFWGCSNLTALPADSSKAKTGSAQVWSQFLTACTSLTTFPWMDLSGATTINSFFNGCTNLQTVAAGLDTSNTTGLFTFFFVGCSNLLSVPLFDTSGGVTFTSFIDGCPLLTGLPAFDTSNGTGFLNFARNCTGLIGQPFPLLNLRKATTLQQFMLSSGMASDSYDAILNDLGASAVNNNVPFHAGNSKYSVAAAAARTFLTTLVAGGGKGWTITDGGPV